MLRYERRQFRIWSHMPFDERPAWDTSQRLRQFTQIRRAISAVVGKEDEVVHRPDDAPVGSWTDTYVLHLLDLGRNDLLGDVVVTQRHRDHIGDPAR